MDLEKAKARVLSLQRTADQFLGAMDTEKAACARADLQVLSERTQTLLTLCLSYMSTIESQLNISRETSVREIGSEVAFC